MRIVRAAELSYVPAGHEDPQSPGVWKKVLFVKEQLRPGVVQMLNWARLAVGRSFAAHYHEDMQEIFVIVRGEAEITVGAATAVLRCGDAVLIDPGEVHTMRNASPDDVEYLALGISGGAGGRTVRVEPGGPSAAAT